nr:MAG TPA: hypothetical protein [Caudoviricetes sp.]
MIQARKNNFFHRRIKSYLKSLYNLMKIVILQH